MAGWILDNLPSHLAYVEPYFGGGSVLFAKPPVTIELVNDLDGSVAAFWRTVRDHPIELAEMLQFTPFARAELAASTDDATLSDIERARRFAVRVVQSRYLTSTAAFRVAFAGGGPLVTTWRRLPLKLQMAAERLSDVTIESVPALDLIRRLAKQDNAADILLYVDPPYLGIDLYQKAMDEQDHRDLLVALQVFPGPVALSGYASDIYDQALATWNRHERVTKKQAGRYGIEVLWTREAIATSQSRWRIPVRKRTE